MFSSNTIGVGVDAGERLIAHTSLAWRLNVSLQAAWGTTSRQNPPQSKAQANFVLPHNRSVPTAATAAITTTGPRIGSVATVVRRVRRRYSQGSRCDDGSDPRETLPRTSDDVARWHSRPRLLKPRTIGPGARELAIRLAATPTACAQSRLAHVHSQAVGVWAKRNISFMATANTVNCHGAVVGKRPCGQETAL